MLSGLSIIGSKLNNLLTTFYGYFALVISCLLLIILCGTWSLIALILYGLLPKRHVQTLSRQGISIGFRLYVAILGGLGWLITDTRSLDPLKTSGPMVITPNHPGLLDAMVILTALPALGLVLKASLLDHPLLGIGARLAGYIPNHLTLAMIREGRHNLSRGQHLLLFPEGTRTHAPPINPLSKSGALLALKANVPIQTILIDCPSGYLGKGWPITKPPKIPVRITLRLGKQFPPIGPARQLTHRMENYFKEALNPPFAPASKTFH